MARSIISKILPGKFCRRLRDVSFPKIKLDIQESKLVLEHIYLQIQKSAPVVGRAEVMHIVPVLGLSYVDRLVHSVIPVENVGVAFYSISHGKHLVSAHVHDFEIHDIDVIENSRSTPY